MIITIIVAIFASGGFWAFLTMVLQRKDEKSPEKLMLRALAQDRIIHLAEKYIERGNITHDEYENIHYLYGPYSLMHGNCLVGKYMEKVDRLPMRQGEVS